MIFPSALAALACLAASRSERPFAFDQKKEIMAYHRSSDVETGRLGINPGNTVAELDENLFSLNFRGDYKATWAALEGSWGPRGILDLAMGDFDGEPHSLDHIEWEIYSQYAKVKANIGENLYAVGGRYRMDWGPSTFVNPSNPFVVETGRVNPKIESPPRDFLQVNYALDSWELGLIANLTEGEDPSFRAPYFEFSRTYAAILDYYGQSQNLSLVLASDEEGHRRAAGYGQRNLSNSMVAWLDASVEEGIHLFVPAPDTGFIPWKMEDEGDRNGTFFHAAVAGLSYTTVLGPTVSLEYYRNDKGYDDDEADLYYSMIEESAVYRFDLLALLARRNLGRALNPGQPFLRRNYLFFQTGETDAWGQLDYSLRYIQNLDDGGGQVSGVFEWNLANRWQLFLVGLRGFGDDRTEFGRFLDGQIMAGFIFRT